MFHYRKDFTNLTRDYQAQDESGLPEITPVVIADDARDMVTRLRPTYAAQGTMAATAAVYGLIGIAAGALGGAIEIQQLYVSGAQASNVALLLGIADLRTANQATVTIGATQTWLRGQTQAALLYEGTTTVAPAATQAFLIYDTGGATSQEQQPLISPGLGIVLRAGEFLWCEAATVNIAFSVNILWREWRFPLPANPPNLL